MNSLMQTNSVIGLQLSRPQLLQLEHCVSLSRVVISWLRSYLQDRNL